MNLNEFKISSEWSGDHSLEELLSAHPDGQVWLYNRTDGHNQDYSCPAILLRPPQVPDNYSEAQKECLFAPLHLTEQGLVTRPPWLIPIDSVRDWVTRTTLEGGLDVLYNEALQRWREQNHWTLDKEPYTGPSKNVANQTIGFNVLEQGVKAGEWVEVTLMNADVTYHSSWCDAARLLYQGNEWFFDSETFNVSIIHRLDDGSVSRNIRLGQLGSVRYDQETKQLKGSVLINERGEAFLKESQGHLPLRFVGGLCADSGELRVRYLQGFEVLTNYNVNHLDGRRFPGLKGLEA